MTDTSTPQQQHYFASDGNYGDAAGLVILDTTNWRQKHFDYIAMLSEGKRAEVAEDIMLGHGSIDQQDCPGIFGAALDRPCGFTGWVYRHFSYPEQGEEGGYTWECPECGSENEYEGIDPVDEPASETIQEPCS